MKEGLYGRIIERIFQNIHMATPLRVGTSSADCKKVSVCRFVKGVPAGMCVAFTLDKSERTNYSPCADDVYTKRFFHIP